MLEIVESFIYTHYTLTGTIIKGFSSRMPQGRSLYFFKVRGDDGKCYDINVPLFSRNFQKLQANIGCSVVLKIEGYSKGGVERFILLSISGG